MKGLSLLLTVLLFVLAGHLSTVLKRTGKAPARDYTGAKRLKSVVPGQVYRL